jgi:hypothetical protein
MIMGLDWAERHKRKQCAKECRDLASWLQDRAEALDDHITDAENTLSILKRYVGRMKSRIDNAGWVGVTKGEALDRRS